MKFGGVSLQLLSAMCIYLVMLLVIGSHFARRANQSTENYFIGGRTLGPWVAAMAAEASDMSGWLLMGLPGVAYWCGIADAFWTAAGLALGTFLNWLLVAKPLRRYTQIAGNAITIPDYFSNRFKDKSKTLMGLSAVFILVFFSVYGASCFVTCGKLFVRLFGGSYHVMMVIGALFVIAYTFIGGFLASSTLDFVQALLMIFTLILVLWFGVSEAGGLGVVAAKLSSIPGFMSLTSTASPVVKDGVQTVANNTAAFGAAAPYGLLTILSTASWGLGYFGMPQVLVHFIAIRNSKQLTRSTWIASIWCVISLGVAVTIGVVGRFLEPTRLLTASDAESVFILMGTRLLPPFLAGIAMSGILAATFSSADTYLLIAASAFSKNIYEHLIHHGNDDRQIMKMTRIALLTVAVVGLAIAMDENSVIFRVVSFAWAGFGATFGPLILFSLFWRRTNREGAIAGVVVGAAMVFIWKLVIRPIGGLLGIYELMPAFLCSCAAIVIVSLLTPPPSAEILAEFDQVQKMGREEQ